MNTINLSNDQIADLFTFCEKHHVHHYDVQLELVDHLANAIEEKLSADPATSFETALQKVHAGFGALGFSNMVTAKTAAMERYCFTQRLKLYKSYFTWPKIAMSVCILAFFIVVKPLLTPNGRKEFIDIVRYGLLLFELFMIGWAGYRFKRQTRKLLIVDTGRNTGYLFVFCIINWISVAPWDKSNLTYYGFAVISTLFLVYVLAYRDFAIKLNRMVRQQYPAAFAITN